MDNPLFGFYYLLDGFKLIFKPGIKRYVIIPVLINILFFITLFLTLNYYVHLFNVWMTAHIPDWLYWLAIIVWVLFFICFILLFLYTFLIFANIIAAPFNSILSEKVELYLTGNPLVDRGWVDNFKDIPRVIGRQFAILGYFLPRALLLLILFFIPVIQVVAGILWFLFSAWIVTLTYMDYPTDNHRIPVKTVREQLKKTRFLSLGFGISVLLFFMIPIINFFTLPAAVAGATKLWLDLSSARDDIIKKNNANLKDSRY